MTIDPNILIYILLGLTLFVAVWLLRIELRLKHFLKGENGRTLEGAIKKMRGDVDDLQTFEQQATQAMSILNEKIATSIRGVGLVRFNPFKGKGYGGNQSFAIALLDVDGNGIIISSLYTRERVSTYAKEVYHFESKHELTSEEKKAIIEAKKTLA